MVLLRLPPIMLSFHVPARALQLQRGCAADEDDACGHSRNSRYSKKMFGPYTSLNTPSALQLRDVSHRNLNVGWMKQGLGVDC